MQVATESLAICEAFGDLTNAAEALCVLGRVKTATGRHAEALADLRRSVALAQLARFIIRGRIIIGGHWLPFWPSAIAFFVLGALSVWLWQLSRESR